MFNTKPRNIKEGRLHLKAYGCPWCNTPPNLTIDETKTQYKAACVNKKCFVKPFIVGVGYEHVVKKWNGRTPEDDLTEFQISMNINTDLYDMDD